MDLWSVQDVPCLCPTEAGMGLQLLHDLESTALDGWINYNML